MNGHVYETPKRLHPLEDVRRRLYALSRNVCAFPNCVHPVVNEEGKLIAQICHIEAALPGGERFNPKQTNEQRRSFENLILLCGTHHTETNDVTRYKTETMREMKRAHEALAFNSHIVPSSELQDRFIDATKSQCYGMPENFRQLDLTGWDERQFVEAARVLERIGQLPALTRSLYAHALAYSVPGDLFLFVDPIELSLRLQEPITKLDPHFAILSRHDLVTEWQSWEAERMNLQFTDRHFYLRGLDHEDYGIHFLYLMRKRYANTPELLIDIIENLKFSLLDN